MRVNLWRSGGGVISHAHMVYRTHVPRPPLSDFVELFWLYEGYDAPHAKERVLPDGSMELVINLRDDELRVYDRRDTDLFRSFRGYLVSGAHSEYVVIDTDSQDSLVGVHFKPGGAFPFLGLPAGELRDAHASLDELWGARAIELRDRLLEAETPEAKFNILEHALLTQAARLPRRHPAVTFALKEFQDVSRSRTISEVTGQVGLSPRRFIQVFREEVGLTPKLFCRVRRFQEVVRLTQRGQHVEWGDVALACGYFDQAHFIHDFRAFSGLSPTTYLADRGEHLNHVALRE